MATIEQHALLDEDRVVLTGISWEMYEQLPQFRAWVRERFSF